MQDGIVGKMGLIVAKTALIVVKITLIVALLDSKYHARSDCRKNGIDCSTFGFKISCKTGL